MAIQVIKTVGAGGDYANLPTAFAALPASLVSADQQWELRVLAGEQVLTAPIDFGTKTQDATRYIHLTAAPGAEWWVNTAAPVRYGSGARLRFTAGSDTNNGWHGYIRLWNYGRLSNLAIQRTEDMGSVCSIVSMDANCLVSRCLIDWASGMASSSTLIAGNGDANVVAQNVLIRSGAQDNGSAIGVVTRISTAGASTPTVVVNNVFIRTANLAANGVAIDAGQGRDGCLAIDNLVLGSWGSAAYTPNPIVLAAGCRGTATSCADGTGTTLTPGTGNTFGLVAANMIQGLASPATLDARLKSGFTALPGQRNLAYTADIDVFGQARSTTAPQIGAQEKIASSDVMTPLASTPAMGAIAASGAQTLTGATRQFQMTLYQENGSTPLAGRSGLWWAWWSNIANVGTSPPTINGTGAATNGSGVITLPAPGVSAAGPDQGWGFITDQDNTPDAGEVGYMGKFDVI